jgi:hypothetical protein
MYYLRVVAANAGAFSYALDDAYIHLAVAKTFWQSGTWGINPGEFSTPTSSLLWPLLLAPVHMWPALGELWPLVLNACAAVLITLVLYHVFQSQFQNHYTATALALLISLLIPTIPYTLTGMEHLAQVALVIAFIYELHKAERVTWRLHALALLLGAIRFESIVVVAIGSLWLLSRRDLKNGVTLLALGLLPAVVFGIISLVNGWQFLPASVLLKTGNAPLLVRFKENLLYSLPLGAPQWILLTLTLPVVWLQLQSRRFTAAGVWYAWLLLLVIAHLFGKGIPSYSVLSVTRYELYLLAIAGIATIVTIREVLASGKGKRYLLILPIAIGMSYLFSVKGYVTRTLDTYSNAVLASSNIYAQQVQMAKVADALPGRTIALNDIGAVSYYTDNRVIDIYGLANRRVAQRKFEGNYTTDTIDLICREEKVSLAAAYDPRFFHLQGTFPSSWALVERWGYRNAYVLGGDTVYFFALDSSSIPAIKSALNAASASLPANASRVYSE